jgi:hypothetical protein
MFDRRALIDAIILVGVIIVASPPMLISRKIGVLGTS